jgi:hypothetical protein
MAWLTKVAQARANPSIAKDKLVEVTSELLMATLSLLDGESIKAFFKRGLRACKTSEAVVQDVSKVCDAQRLRPPRSCRDCDCSRFASVVPLPLHAELRGQVQRLEAVRHAAVRPGTVATRATARSRATQLQVAQSGDIGSLA